MSTSDRTESDTVAVVRGGIGGEREISLLSGGSILEGLKSAGLRTLDVVIDGDGRWRIGGGAAEPQPILTALALLASRVGVVFPVLHGRFGEDGTLQGVLDSVGMCYVGSGVAASAIAMDKLLTRRVAQSLGLLVAPAVEGGPDRSSREVDRIAREASRLAMPCFVKPACSGSSVGVTRVVSPEQLRPAIEAALAEGGRVVVEQGVLGDEVSCPIVGDAGIDSRPLPIVAIVPKGHDFFDYQAKYTAGHSDEICPAPLPAPLAARLSAAARAVHDALGCRSVSRSDFIVRKDGEPVFLEVNTMPGMSPLSLVPKALAAAGIRFADQCAAWVDGALRERLRQTRLEKATTA